MAGFCPGGTTCLIVHWFVQHLKCVVKLDQHRPPMNPRCVWPKVGAVLGVGAVGGGGGTEDPIVGPPILGKDPLSLDKQDFIRLLASTAEVFRASDCLPCLRCRFWGLFPLLFQFGLLV